MNYRQLHLKVRLAEKARKRQLWTIRGWASPYAESIFSAKGHYYDDNAGDRLYVGEAVQHFRHVGEAAQIINSRNNGYYTDHFCEGTVKGQVYQISAKRKAMRYLAAYMDPCDDTTTLCMRLFDSKSDAAFYADELARISAERSREFDAKDAAEQEIERLQEEISEARKDCLALLREAKPLREKGDSQSVLCRELRKSVKRYMSTIAKKRERILALSYNYWLAVEDC